MASKILVTGYTGRLGGLVASELRDRHGVEPRILVRRPHVDAPDWRPPEGMEVATGDFRDPSALDAALEGIDAVFLVSPVHPEMRARELALAERAATQPKPPALVKISGLGTRLDSFVDSGRWHAEIERGVRDLGLTATFLRPLFFMQNLGFQARNMRDRGVLEGAVDDAAIAMIDARDIAEVAGSILMDVTRFEGRAMTLTGARSFTYEEVAAAASEAFGRRVTYERQTLDEVRSSLERAGQPDWHIEILLQFNKAFMQGWGNEISDAVSQVLGRAPRSLEAYLEELAAGALTPGSNPFPS